jgi:AraC-like DNA-binding protein
LRVRSADWSVHGAVEHRAAGEKYDWHGLRRGADPAHPIVLFQCALSGWGEFVEGGNAPVRVSEGMAFCAPIPTDHRYHLPDSSPGWGFAWLMIDHPYIVSRIIAQRRTLPAVVPVDIDGALFSKVARLLEPSSRSVRDPFAVEQTLFEFLIEYERLASALLHPAEKRDVLLSKVRTLVMESARLECDVEEIAESFDMSRSHFAHHFKAVTGQTPARFMTELRLDEAVRLLADPRLKLEVVANATGFADANHFCKVFRRHFHVTPGEYRKQLR